MAARKSIVVRKARFADLGQVQALQAAAFRIAARETYEAAAIEHYLVRLAAPAIARDVAAGSCHVIEIDGDVVAAGSWSATSALDGNLSGGSLGDATEAHISGLYVDPSYRGRGLSEDLLRRIECDVAICGYTSVVLAAIYPGMPFATRTGFRPFSLVTVRIGEDDLSGVAFRKQLAARMARAA